MTIPPGYAEDCDRLEKIVSAAAKGDLGKPLFAFGPKDTFVIAALDDCKEHVARNDAARRVVALACEGRGSRVPTLMMLRMVIEKLGLPFEEVSIDEILSWVPGAIPVRLR